MQTLAIIDYGMGNLHSAAKAIEHVATNTRVIVTDKAELIRNADRVVFPGVGAIRDCMHELKRLELDQVIRDVVNEKPTLAICVGMQALMDSSEENNGTSCLGIIQGDVRFFGNAIKEVSGQDRLKIPHMGWNQVYQTIDHPLWHDIESGSRFYFVHSYYVKPAAYALVSGESEYGIKFAASLARDKLFAVQFHPEKSQNAGLQLLANFCVWKGQ